MAAHTLRTAAVSGIIAAGLLTTPCAHADEVSMGLEGFYDRYHEPLPDVTEQSDYGSLTGHYAHNWGSAFGAVDLRGSYGNDKYSSPDGTDSNIPQYELEGRLRAGISLPTSIGTLSPYVGIGTRYFVDEAKNTVTSLGYVGYDRRITQVYVPLGVTYSITTDGGWTLAPNLEYDPLVWGNVNSRLQNDNYYNINNTQHDGYGIRGEFMAGRQEASGWAWQFGPFFRYWDIKNSDTTSTPDGLQWIEPANTRLQVGAALRILW